MCSCVCACFFKPVLRKYIWSRTCSRLHPPPPQKKTNKKNPHLHIDRAFESQMHLLIRPFRLLDQARSFARFNHRPQCLPSPPPPPPSSTTNQQHSPVLVSSADMLHATKRTLQTKHTCTKSISLLLRTLNILAMIVFLDALCVSASSPRCSMLLGELLGRRPLFFCSRACVVACTCAPLRVRRRGGIYTLKISLFARKTWMCSSSSFYISVDLYVTDSSSRVSPPPPATTNDTAVKFQDQLLLNWDSST